MKRIFSGIQSSGNLHLGNYLGAIRNWVTLQQEGTECIYGIMNLHAITVPQDPEALRKSIYETAAALIACGVDPKKSVIFQQSSVSAHAELAWILGCHTPLGWLNRMTQFKDKLRQEKKVLKEVDNALGAITLDPENVLFEKAKLGLYGYPVLMAADVLGYKATHVPVGEDQKQHIELMRDIAGAFNRAYKTEFFPLPEPLILGAGTRVMSLRDGTKKMSKSDESDYSRINLTDDADAIDLKFRKAKSDSFTTIGEDLANRPEASNLINIFAALANATPEAVVKGYGAKNFSDFKKALSSLAIEQLSPITSLMRELLKDVSYIDEVLKSGAEKADKVARKTLKQVQEMVGFVEV